MPRPPPVTIATRPFNDPFGGSTFDSLMRSFSTVSVCSVILHHGVRHSCGRSGTIYDRRMFLRNVWYPAAWEREIGQSPYARHHPLRASGDLPPHRRHATPHCDDACPHRKLPLSMGRVQGDHLECGYHGLTFDCAGTCVKAPTNGSVPHDARVRSYPVHARYGLVWIWMGDAARADPADIFHVEHWDDPAWGTTVGDDMTIACNYLYITDNLLDPSHVAWVHPSSFAGAGQRRHPDGDHDPRRRHCRGRHHRLALDASTSRRRPSTRRTWSSRATAIASSSTRCATPAWR